jgi:hypothetical protein
VATNENTELAVMLCQGACFRMYERNPDSKHWRA